MNIFVNGQCRPKLFTLIYSGFWIFSIVSPSVDFTTFEKVHFLYGNNITVTNDLGSLLECLRICRTNCGYVQYTDTGLCVLYSEVLLLTEPAVTEGQMVGYRKKNPRTLRYIAVQGGLANQTFNYDEARLECAKIGTDLAIIRNDTDFNILMNTVQKSGMFIPDFGAQKERMWISGRRTDEVWRWHTGEEIPDPWLWDTGFPTDNNCARINTEKDEIYIRSFICSTNFYQMLCE